MIRSRLKERMKTGEPVYYGGGGWWHPEVAGVVGDIGLDFINFDMQHGSVSYETIKRFINVIDQSKTTITGRTASSATVDISKILDVGALGVIIPDVDDKEETRQIINAAKYPPVGTRSIDHLMTLKESEELNDNTVIIPMIETVLGLENIEEIASEDEVDGILIGPNDLSCSLGIFTQWKHPKFVEAIEKVARVCKKASIYYGIMAPIEPPEKPIELGCNIFSVGGVASFARLGGINKLKQIKEFTQKHRS